MKYTHPHLVDLRVMTVDSDYKYYSELDFSLGHFYLFTQLHTHLLAQFSQPSHLCRENAGACS